MKQLLLRVPEDVHARLSARAAKEGRSINAVATEMLDTAIDVVPSNPQTVLRARAAAAGLLRSVGTEAEVDKTPSIASVRAALHEVKLSAQDLIPSTIELYSSFVHFKPLHESPIRLAGRRGPSASGVFQLVYEWLRKASVEFTNDVIHLAS